MRACLSLVMLLLLAFSAAPAHACSWTPPTRQAFWSEPPPVIAPDEIVLDVELIAPVDLVLDAPDNKGREFEGMDSGYAIYSSETEAAGRGDEISFRTTCYGLTPQIAYKVRRVLRGEFASDTVVVMPDFDMADENLNPLARRILVGRPGTQRNYAIEGDTLARYPLTATVLDIRPAADADRNGWQVAEVLFFRLAGLGYRHLAFAVGAQGMVASGAWAGMFLAALLGLGFAWLAWRALVNQRKSS